MASVFCKKHQCFKVRPYRNHACCGAQHSPPSQPLPPTHGGLHNSWGRPSRTGLPAVQVLRECDLPIRMVALSHCFRTEAGGAGAAGKGLYRVHQFSKVSSHPALLYVVITGTRQHVAVNVYESVTSSGITKSNICPHCCRMFFLFVPAHFYPCISIS